MQPWNAQPAALELNCAAVHKYFKSISLSTKIFTLR